VVVAGQARRGGHRVLAGRPKDHVQRAHLVVGAQEGVRRLDLLPTVHRRQVEVDPVGLWRENIRLQLLSGFLPVFS